MNEQFIEVEAASLKEARRQLSLQIPENLTILHEQVLSIGNLGTVEGIADTMKEAMSEAKAKVPAGAKILPNGTVITPPERKVIQLKGIDEKSALDSILLSPDLDRIESLTLNKQGRKGFLGFGRTTNIYDLTIIRKAKVKVSFTEMAKIRAKIGLPHCQRCDAQVLRQREFLDECGKAGLLLIDGNLYGGTNDQAKVEIYRNLENRKGFRCSSCSNIYCMHCLFNFAPAGSHGGKACFECKGRFERYD